MKKIALITILFILTFFTPVFAQDDGRHQINPYQEEVWRGERMLKEMKSREKNPDEIVSKSFYADYITTTQAPSLGGKGKWNINIDASHGAVTNVDARIMMKDYTEDYTTLYYKTYTSAISSFESCQILSAGEYSFVLWVYFADGNFGYDEYQFKINDDASHTSLTEKINEIVSISKGATQWETALNMHDWIINNVYYDGNYEFYGADMILRGYGVCDGYSKAFYMLCQAAGIPVGRVSGGNHAWNVLKLNNQWYYVDPTWDDPGTTPPAVSGYEHHDYFCINEEILKMDHTISEKEGQYGSCTSLDMNYHIVTGKWKNWRMYTSNYTEVTIPDYIIMSFENEGETVLKFNENIYRRENSDDSLYGGGVGYPKILYYAFSKESFKDSEGTTISVKVTANPTALTLLTPINVLRLPKNVEIIPSEAFYGIGAKKVVLRASSITIESRAFANSKVKTVVLPDWYYHLSIADDAFENCSNVVFVTDNSDWTEYLQNLGFTVRPGLY